MKNERSTSNHETFQPWRSATFTVQKQTAMKLKTQVSVALTAVILFGAILISSCMKSYVCKCTLTSGSSSITTQTYDLGKKKRSDAKAECKNKEGAFVGLVYSCELE